MKFGAREILFLLLLAAIPIGSWCLVFHPRDRRIEEAKQEITAKRAKLNSLNRATATMKDLESEIKQYNEAIAFFRGKLPQEKEMDQVLGEVWKLAQSSNLNVTGVRTISRVGAVSLTDPQGPYAEQPVRLQLEGDFNEALYSFLLALEKRPRITRLHKLDVQKIAETDKGTGKVEGRVKADIEMSVFFERSAGEE